MKVGKQSLGSNKRFPNEFESLSLGMWLLYMHSFRGKKNTTCFNEASLHEGTLLTPEKWQKILFHYILIIFFNWSIVYLQCCVNFRYTRKGFSYVYIKLSMHRYYFSHSFPLEVITRYRMYFMCFTVGLCCLSILMEL